jgi:hypothetical protein
VLVKTIKGYGVPGEGGEAKNTTHQLKKMTMKIAADPSLTLGPAIAHFGWDREDWDRLAGATMAGHLLECGAQVTGGYFADPGYKDVPDIADTGYPIAEIAAVAEVSANAGSEASANSAA